MEKRLICKVHRQYRGYKPPKGDCHSCLIIYFHQVKLGMAKCTRAINKILKKIDADVYRRESPKSYAQGTPIPEEHK